MIVHNLRPGVDERLGIDYRTVARVNPDVVYLSLTAFDGPRPGPWSGLPGFDPVLQAATGIQLRYGGPGNRPELHGFAATIDYLTGYSGVFGIALALLQRRRTGGGDLIKTSLAQGGQLAQATLMWSTARQRPDREPQGQTAQGEGALQHLYEASDGWLFLAAPAARWARLRAVPELAAIAGAGSDAAAAEAQRIAALAAALRRRPVAHWVRVLNAAGVGCHRTDRIEELRRTNLHQVRSDALDAWQAGRSISIVRMLDHPAGSAADTPAPTYARFKHHSVRLACPNPKVGSNTRAILRELGHDDARIDGWLATGVIKEQLHHAYVPF